MQEKKKDIKQVMMKDRDDEEIMVCVVTKYAKSGCERIMTTQDGHDMIGGVVRVYPKATLFSIWCRFGNEDVLLQLQLFINKWKNKKKKKAWKLVLLVRGMSVIQGSWGINLF